MTSTKLYVTLVAAVLGAIVLFTAGRAIYQSGKNTGYKQGVASTLPVIQKTQRSSLKVLREQDKLIQKQTQSLRVATSWATSIAIREGATLMLCTNVSGLLTCKGSAP